MGDRRRARPTNGSPKADPNGGFAFPLYGHLQRDQVALNASQVSLQFSFGPVPLRSLDFRGALGADGSFAPGASLYGQVTCADVPNYSVYLYDRRASATRSDTLASYGTFLSDGYDGAAARTRSRRACARAGWTLTRADRDRATARRSRRCGCASGTRYRAAGHLVSILLVDAATGAPVSLDYRTLTDAGRGRRRATWSARGCGSRRGRELPASVRAYTIADVYPLASTQLSP